MPSAPTIEWRNSTTPFAVISSLALTGTGSGGAVPVGTTSNISTVRIYNNFAAAASIADATTCLLAAYDDSSHQGQATTAPVTGAYMQVTVVNYNGSTTGADGGTYYNVGGTLKHAVPTNGGTISGTGANYITVSLRVVVPASAAAGSITQGVWLEYNSSA